MLGSHVGYNLLQIFPQSFACRKKCGNTKRKAPRWPGHPSVWPRRLRGRVWPRSHVGEIGRDSAVERTLHRSGAPLPFDVIHKAVGIRQAIHIAASSVFSLESFLIKKLAFILAPLYRDKTLVNLCLLGVPFALLHVSTGLPALSGGAIEPRINASPCSTACKARSPRPVTL